ncbi:MAG: MBL fold metallo-hydrolase [Phycisphaerae bacterium]
MARLLFHGACGEVTGSMHIIEHEGHYFALDCGLFQGRRSEANTKNKTFPVDPAKIEAVILSHAHIDHCGRLPRLIKDGFAGTIFTTPASHDLAAILLADAAHIQTEDAEFFNRKRRKNGEPPVEPLYMADDAAKAMKYFVSYPYNHQFEIGYGIKVRFRDAGHILGSSIVELEFPNPGKPPTRLCYSGDLGRPNMPILQDPSPMPECECLIIESTYGARIHDNPTDMKEKLRQQILLAVERGGKIIIPAFSVGRTQVLVYYLHQLVREGQLPHIPIFIDSPLSTKATEIFRAHPECFDTEATSLLNIMDDIMGDGCCQFIRDTEESKALNTFNKPCVIISASGMCEAGRILHHLANNVTDSKNTILIVGFQAMYTLGRRIVDRVPEVKIFGRMYPLKAHVKTLNGFSSHADANEFRGWLGENGKTTRQVFVVHGEPDQQQGLVNILQTLNYQNIQIPKMGDTFELG